MSKSVGEHPGCWNAPYKAGYWAPNRIYTSRGEYSDIPLFVEHRFEVRQCDRPEGVRCDGCGK